MFSSSSSCTRMMRKRLDSGIPTARAQTGPDWELNHAYRFQRHDLEYGSLKKQKQKCNYLSVFYDPPYHQVFHQFSN